LFGDVTFLIFGAALLGPALDHASWLIALIAVIVVAEAHPPQGRDDPAPDIRDDRSVGDRPRDHGSATATRYARCYESYQRGAPAVAESVTTPDHRTGGAPNPNTGPPA
jgi:hypothetical protein